MVAALDGNAPICEIYNVATYHENAHLIAAAPDLLEALERLERLSGSAMMTDDPAREWARAAIAKAKGEMP